MKKFLILPFLLFAVMVNAQSLNRKYYEGINFKSSKSEVIEIVLGKLRYYLENDINGSATYLKKKKGINIKSGKNKEEKYIKLEDAIRSLLQQTDDWNQVDLYRPYNLDLSSILGNNVTMQMISGSANSGNRGAGTFMVSFFNGYVSSMYITLQTTRDYTNDSGFPYNNAHLAEVASTIKREFGIFTFRQGANIWNSCSTNNENVPVITYFISNGNYSAEMTWEYGILQQRIIGSYKGACRAIGNHLTSVTMRVTKK